MAFVHGTGRFAGQVEVSGTKVTETARAWLLEFTDGRREWLPRRFATLIEERDGTVAAIMPQWLAKSKGLA